MAHANLLDNAQDETQQAVAMVGPGNPATVSATPVIGAVSLSGAEAIGFAALAPAYEPFIGQPAEQGVLQTLARTLADAARQRGYLFATAVVPEQAVNIGVVRVQMELGAIDEVRILGSANAQVRSILNRLVGPAPTAAKVERQLLLAGDLPGITVLGSRYDQTNGRRVLEVKVSEVKLRGSVGLDNYGPRAYGPVRARANATFYNVGRPGSQLNVQALRATDRDELSYGGVRYSATVAGGRGVVGLTASAARSEPGGRFVYPLAGQSRYAAAYGSWVLKRARAASLWINSELAYLGLEQSSAGVAFQDERTLTASTSLSGNRAVGEGRLQGEIGVTRGLVPARRLDAELRTVRGPSSVFTRTNAAVSYWRPIGQKSSVRIAAQGQTAARALPTSQQMGVGGPAYGRAYDFNERFGDKGAVLSVEATRALTASGLQAYAFADAGKVSQVGAAKYGQGSLSSAGVGLRLQTKRVDADVYVAKPLRDDRFATADRSPRVGASLSWKF